MDNVLKQYYIIPKLKDAFFTTDFLTLRKDDCAKMHFFVLDLMFLNNSHFFAFNEKRGSGDS